MCGECVKAGLPADRCALAEENTARKNRPLLAAWDLIPLACLWLRKFCVRLWVCFRGAQTLVFLSLSRTASFCRTMCQSSGCAGYQVRQSASFSWARALSDVLLGCLLLLQISLIIFIQKGKQFLCVSKRTGLLKVSVKFKWFQPAGACWIEIYRKGFFFFFWGGGHVFQWVFNSE